ncbi:L-cystine-binding protein FliY [bioreactor metagenome]|uniref:L-cystine-binding protein FliY n=1 Tax=bioreactor metagenome TaxID=1076179 RepID=A0A645C0W9_9ZZZZ|nr:basic amino acid ABC transporter substrate-binding protein [Oscillospiraceae bacterium]
MKIKKIALIMSILTLFALFASSCGNTPTLDTIKNRGKLVMATNAAFPPFEQLESGKFVGFDVDLANEIAKYIGVELEIVDIDFDSIVGSIDSGKYDVGIAGMTADEDKKKNVDFSDDYYKASQNIIVTSDSAIADVSGLTGKTVACQEGTTGEKYCQENGYTIQSYKSGSEAVIALIAGKVDAVVIDNLPALALAEENSGKVKVLTEPLTEETYAIAVKKGNSTLLKAINDALASIKASGRLAEIYAQYNIDYEG